MPLTSCQDKRFEEELEDYLREGLLVFNQTQKEKKEGRTRDERKGNRKPFLDDDWLSRVSPSVEEGSAQQESLRIVFR